MKKFLIRLTFLLLGYLTLYLLKVFMIFEFNILKWSSEVRGVYLILGFIVGALYIFIHEISKHTTKNK